MHNHTEEEGDSHTHEDGDNHAQRLVRVKQVGKAERRVGCNLDSCKDERTAKQFEHERNGSRGRHAERVEHVEHDNVCNHYGKEDGHYVIEREIGRLHNAVSCHVHHTRGHYSANCHTCRSNDKHRAELRHLSSDGAVKEVDGVVTYSNKKVEYCQT